MPLNVADMRANVAETIRHAAQVIGRSKQRRALFAAIYHGKKAVKTVPELAETTGLSEKRVLEEGRKLAANQLVEQEKVDGRVAYKKDGAISGTSTRSWTWSIIRERKIVTRQSKSLASQAERSCIGSRCRGRIRSHRRSRLTK